jgi:septum site-determining protein MinC
MITDIRTAADEFTREPSFRLKGGLFPMTLLDLNSGDLQELRHDLTLKVAEAPAFFQQAPAVLSFEQLPLDSAVIELGNIVQLCLEFGMIVVALKGGSDELLAQAKELNLALLPAARTKPKDSVKTRQADPVKLETEPAEQIDETSLDNIIATPTENTQQELTLTTPAADQPEPSAMVDKEPSAVANKEPSAAVNETPSSKQEPKPVAAALTPPTANCKIISTPVRSGQQIYAAGGDLIVLAPVSAGAELLADGNIHVYGALRGRALAGVKGDTNARVFCQSQEAELISIAGCFMVDEDLRSDHWKQPVQVILKDESLQIQSLS